ncbi:hypothetical protein T484DRAFT_1898964 [Baffinella frigidus]|nr:hypothetical protein T484DRAFT_1898964 [Cryptophyta sp. CCMP2293]
MQVTVPLVIALGVGVAQAGHNPSPLTGFGVVTFASLIPVNFVLLLTLFLPEQIPHKGASNPSGGNSTSAEMDIVPGGEGDAGAWAQQTPYMETISGVRALVPLVAFMFLLLRVVLKDSKAVLVNVDLGQGRSVMSGIALPLLAAQVGIIVFNVGLTQGLAKLGEIVGGVMPSAFAPLPQVPGSPLWGRSAGIAIAVVFAFVLGFGATLAEPALATLAHTVDKLSKGAISKRQVVLSVALGVGAGTALGLLKVIMQIPLLPMIIPGYFLAAVLSVPSTEVLVNVAWDSAGVTTGPVTVPLVISIGLGLGKGLAAADGFGILSLASVCPIVSVLAIGLVMQRRGDPTGKVYGDGDRLLGPSEDYTHESDEELQGDLRPQRKHQRSSDSDL